MNPSSSAVLFVFVSTFGMLPGGMPMAVSLIIVLAGLPLIGMQEAVHLLPITVLGRSYTAGQYICTVVQPSWFTTDRRATLSVHDA